MDSCREEKDTLEKTWTLLERWPSVEPSADFRAKFWQKVDNLNRDKRAIFPRPVYRRLAPVLASVLFVIILAGAIFMKTRIENINLAKEIELYQDLDVIENIDLLVELDAI